jgi:hypothetical protein
VIAQRRHEVMRPVTIRPRARRAKRPNFLRALIHNRMACVVMLALAVSMVLSIYVSAYATATETGYHRSELVAQLKKLRIENEMLRLKLEEARQPDQIAAFAVANGMEQGTKMMYLAPNEQQNIARSLDQ